MSAPPPSQDRTGDLQAILQHLRSHAQQSPEFFAELVGAQCFVTDARDGAILLQGANESLHLLALYPHAESMRTVPDWLHARLTQLARMGKSPESANAPEEFFWVDPARNETIVCVPMQLDGNEGRQRLIGVYRFSGTESRVLALAKSLLEAIFVCALSAGQSSNDGVEALRRAVDASVATQSATRFAQAGLHLCSQCTSLWLAQRVVFGVMEPQGVRIVAMNHAEKIEPKAELLRQFSDAMEECIAQDTEVLVPAADDWVGIARAGRTLSQAQENASVLSLPLRHNGKVFGCLTMTRQMDRPLRMDEVRGLRLMAELVAPRLYDQHRRDRWFGAHAKDALLDGAARFVGPTQTGAKLVGLLLLVALVLSASIPGTYRVEAPCLFQPHTQHLISVPFDGFLETAQVIPGDVVRKDETVLATMQTAELRLERAGEAAQRAEAAKEAALYRRENEIAKAQMAQAREAQAVARLDVLDYKIHAASLRSPIDGVVLSGDYRHESGKPWKMGELAFTVAPLEGMESVLHVPEDQIADVRVGQSGEVAAIGYPDQRMAFVVESITPMADVIDGRNIFQVRVRLQTVQVWVRPGMEGLGKISAGERSYLWIWTRKVVNWVRMKLWI